MVPRSHRPLSYPIVIKQVHESLVISSPDLETHLSLYIGTAPITEKLMFDVMEKILKLWSLAQNKTKDFSAARMKPPVPSSIRGVLSVPREHELNLPDAAKALSVSQNTLRRMIKRGAIKARFTDGGHRRISEVEIREYLERKSTNGKRQTPHSPDAPALEPRSEIIASL